MGFSARSRVSVLAVASVLALAFAPSIAAAQGAAAPPPPGGGGAPAPGGGAPAGADGAAAADTKKVGGDIGGFSFSDKPAPRSAPQRARIIHRSGPLATFPGFEQLASGGSRLFVQLSQTVPVEQRVAP